MAACNWATRALPELMSISTATRAPAPRSGLTKSSSRACSACVCVAWSKPTLAWLIGNHPPAPLPLPLTAVCIEIIVHMARLSLPLQVLVEEGKDLAPAIHCLLLPVERPIVVKEAVAGAIVAMELVVLTVLLELRLVRVHIGWGW